MKCKNCGNVLNENDNFCGICGTKSNQTTTTNKKIIKIKFIKLIIVIGIITIVLIAFIFYKSKSNLFDNGHLYTYYTNSKENTTTKNRHSKAAINWYYDNENNITDGEIILHIGDYINYDEQTDANKLQYISLKSKNGYANQTFTLTDYKYGWRILGIENGQILITTEDIISPTDGYISTDEDYQRSYYTITSATGYINAIQELNNICSLYGQGKGANKSRSITVEDINIITGYKPNSPTSSYEYWPTTLSSIFFFFSEKIGIKSNSVVFDLLFKNPKENSAVADKYKGSILGYDYWLASTFSNGYFGGNATEYGLRCIKSGDVGIATLYANTTQSSSILVGKTNACVRPVIYLDKTVKLIKSQDGSNYYNIVL